MAGWNAWGTTRRKSRGSPGTGAGERIQNRVRTSVDGKSFASKFEAAVYRLLTAEAAMGTITGLRTQHNVDLVAGIRMIPDFSFYEGGVLTFAEAKGFETDVYRLKLRLWKAGFGPGPMRIYKGSYKNPRLVDVVAPKSLE